MNELIEKLKRKDYARQAGWLKKYRPDEYGILDAAGWRNRLRLDCFQNWVNDSGPIGYSDTLILKPGYQPKPTYNSYPLTAEKGDIGAWYHGFRSTEELATMPEFAGFVVEKGTLLVRFKQE